MQQTVTLINTQDVVSMNMSSTTSTLCLNSIPQLLLNTQSNKLPYSLPSTIVKPLFPQPSHLRLPPPQLLLRKIYLNIHQMSPPEDLHNINLLILTMTNLWKYQPIASPILQFRFIH
ncbi:hypothetical protein O181_078574 [Austropuccinia psidii MF-1]|uniref:Uncharacterized protein n=1 Tax=Austropuccinia psidii MF-1 TaxID=1389203 RepID=A0A9Q3FGS6_9BASI|nr:hypothetical protein [Austropuccinia psidii MF-1]